MRATFITLASHDWRLLPQSIASYYDHADEILVGLDSDGLSWGGGDVDTSGFNEMLELIDPRGKIEVITGRFYDPDKSPLENDSAERESLASQARNEWTVEVDADEVLTDVPTLFATMDTCPGGHQVYAQEWTQIYKTIGDTALVVTPSLQLCALATRSRIRRYARQTGEPAIVAPLTVLHYTAARAESELAFKLANWGHSRELVPGWLDQWRAVSLDNYKAARDLHYTNPHRWPALMAVPLNELRGSLASEASP